MSTLTPQQATISSVDVAEMVNRNHADVMRDIRKIIEHLGGEESKNALVYFTPSNYVSENNQSRPCFLLTKKACELFATRMTGTKGTQFAVKYIERFNEMEQQLQNPFLPTSNLELALQAALKHEQVIKVIITDVDYLKNNMRIDSLQQQEIQNEVNKAIVAGLGGKDSIVYQKLSKKVYSAFWKEFKQFFKVPRYGDIPKVKFSEAIKFIRIWRPSTTLSIEINSLLETKKE